MEAFNQLWTLKESYVKATGAGINAPPGLKGFSFTLQPALSNGSFIFQQEALSQEDMSGLNHRQAFADIANLQNSSNKASGILQNKQDLRQPASTIDFRLPGGPDQAESSSCFALMAPTPNHVAALCVLPWSEASRGSDIEVADGDHQTDCSASQIQTCPAGYT